MKRAEFSTLIFTNSIEVNYFCQIADVVVLAGDTGADVTFRTAWRDAVPLNDGQSLVGPGIYRTVLVRSHHN